MSKKKYIIESIILSFIGLNTMQPFNKYFIYVAGLLTPSPCPTCVNDIDYTVTKPAWQMFLESSFGTDSKFYPLSLFIIIVIEVILLVLLIRLMVIRFKKFKGENMGALGILIPILNGVAIVAVTLYTFIFILVGSSIIIERHSEASDWREPYDAKPILYIYPTEKTDLTIKLEHSNLITHSYPKYEDKWEVSVNTDGTIYDYKTKRNYYALYWDCRDSSNVDMSEGFVIKGEETARFLEEKLAILGLNEREIDEFVIYWLPKMENNKYNFIRFRTKDEMDKYMKLDIDKDVDTIIRVYMDYKPLKNKIKVHEQKLNRVSRSGFTIVEWGGRNIGDDKYE